MSVFSHEAVGVTSVLLRSPVVAITSSCSSPNSTQADGSDVHLDANRNIRFLPRAVHHTGVFVAPDAGHIREGKKQLYAARCSVDLFTMLSILRVSL